MARANGTYRSGADKSKEQPKEGGGVSHVCRLRDSCPRCKAFAGGAGEGCVLGGCKMPKIVHNSQARPTSCRGGGGSAAVPLLPTANEFVARQNEAQIPGLQMHQPKRHFTDREWTTPAPPSAPQTAPPCPAGPGPAAPGSRYRRTWISQPSPESPQSRPRRSE